MIFILEEDGVIYVFGDVDSAAGAYCEIDLLDEELYVVYDSSGQRLKPELDPNGEHRYVAEGPPDREALLGLLESGRPIVERRGHFVPLFGRKRRAKARKIRDEARAEFAARVESLKATLRT